MSSEMVERVARAMMALHYTEDTFDRPASINTREIYLGDARVAIAAMLHPTDEMLTLGARAWAGEYSRPDTMNSYQAMITAALDPDLGTKTADELQQKGLA